MAKSKAMNGYVAVVLDEQSVAVLQGMAVHSNVHCHHLTLSFRPSDEEWAKDYATIEGQTLELSVVGIAADDKGQAALVALPLGIACKNANPHVTISCAEGIAPKYSNDLIAAESAAGRVVSASLVLKGVVTFVRF